MAKKAYIGIGGAARSVKKVYIGVHQVPQAQYAVLEYIESTGTQYIDTGVSLNEKDFSIRGKFLFTSNSGEQPLFSIWTSSYNYWNFFVHPSQMKLDFYASGHNYANSVSLDTEYNIVMAKSGNSYIYGIEGDTTTSSFSSSSNPTTLKILASGGLDIISKNRVSEFKLEVDGISTRNYTPVKRISDDAIGLYDKVEGKFYANAGTGEFSAGAETGEYIYDIPQEGDYARKIKKAYVGVGGVARPFWGGGELVRYGAVTPLSVARKEIGSAKTGRYLLFAGGTTSATVGGTKYNNVDVYSGDLVHSAAAGISNSGYSVCGVTVDQTYALFCGGRADPYDPPFTSADAYDADLAKTTPTSLSYQVRDACGIAVGSRAVICGGKGGTYPNYTDLSDVNCYDGSLTRSVLSSLPFSGYCTAANVGVYGIVTRETPDADATASAAYNEDLTRMTLTSGKHGGYGCRGKGCAVFSRMSVSYAYSEDLTQFDLLPLSQAQTVAGRAYLDGFAIFAGGWPNHGDTLTNAVEAYNGTTLMAAEPMAAARTPAGGTVGGFALFAGGGLSDGVTASAEAYTSI